MGGENHNATEWTRAMSNEFGKCLHVHVLRAVSMDGILNKIVIYMYL